MSSRFPSHQLNNGLYVSGRPEPPKEKAPPMSSTAVPYTGGDIKKSGELGKMFDVDHGSSRPRKSGHLANPPLRTGSMGGGGGGGGGNTNRMSSLSGNVPGASLKKTSSGPLNKHGEPIRKSSGPQGVGLTGLTSASRQNSGPLPPVLPATGLLTSGPILSGPLNSSGGPRNSIIFLSNSNLILPENLLMASSTSPIGFFPAEQTKTTTTTTTTSTQEDMKNTDAVDSPLRSRTTTSTNPATAARRRTAINATSAKTSPNLCRSQSFGREIGHAASETYLITRLAFTLLRYLGVGRRWISRLLALGLYAMLLMPGFLQVLHQYFFSTQIRRSIVYGDQPRNRLDLYLPKNIDSPKPVIVFVTGGAWIIGYKGWGSLLGFQLAERDIIVTCIDYRNFPQGTISDMVEDVSRGISFICNNIANYGGDPNRIYLMGQSAGAHISSCVLLKQAIIESKGGPTSWSVSQIKAYFGLSGGYNLTNLVDHFDQRGLYRSIFLSIMEGDESLQEFSPEILIEDPTAKNAVPLLPHIVLFHGTEDFSIPPDASITYVDALKRAGAKAELILYEGKTHTDLFIQDALRGGKEELFDYIVDYLHAGDTEALANDAMAPPRRRLCPEPLLKLAGLVSPF